MAETRLCEKSVYDGNALGALDMKQKDENGKEYDFPAGIAHFLEHKMFEIHKK